MKKVISCLLIVLNVCACLCLVYFGWLFVSGSTVVDYPDAMLPVERWDRGGWALTMGTVPLLIANGLGYFFIRLGNRKSRLLIFIPSIICIALVACYWIKSLTLDSYESEKTAETTIDMEQAVSDLDDYIAGYSVAFRMRSSEYPDQNIICDFTGDGYDDVITDFTHGSGIIVTTIVVYDAANQVFYTLGEGYNSYRIVSFEDGVLTAEEYVYPDQYTTGTVEFTDDGLVFIP